MAVQQRAVLTRSRVVSAAAEVFARVGFAAASLNDITAQADTTKGALYFHFPGKQALASAIVDEQAAKWPVIFAAVESAAPDPLVAVLSLTYDVGARLREDAVLRAGVRLASEPGLGVSNTPSPLQPWVERTQELLTEARRQGLLRPGVTPAPVARAIIASFVGVQRLSSFQDDDRDLDSRLDEFWKIFLAGVAADPDWAGMQRQYRRTLNTARKALSAS